MSQHEVVINHDQIYKIPSDFIDQAKRFKRQMLIYECAVKEITTKLDVLNTELAHMDSRNPISTIKSRVKKPDSILNKLRKENLPLTLESIDENLTDVAGVRLICSYIDDIYKVVQMLESQDDIRIVAVKDYIKNPKENGYRSLHLIVEIPIFLSAGKEYARVEIQMRTIAMDFWASLEQEIRYKKDLRDLESVSQDLLECANTIAKTDEKMMAIRNEIQRRTI